MITAIKAADILNGLIETKVTASALLDKNTGLVLESRENGIDKIKVKVIAMLAYELFKTYPQSEWSGLELNDFRLGVSIYEEETLLLILMPKSTNWSVLKSKHTLGTQ